MCRSIGPSSRFATVSAVSAAAIHRRCGRRTGLRCFVTVFAVSAAVIPSMSCGADGSPRQDGFADVLWTLEGPELRIGSLDDPDYIFGPVLWVVPGPDGSVYSLHVGEAIRRWTAEGAPAGSVGRQGEGPGEFIQPGFVGFFGDSLVVMDYRLYRASYFDLAGEFLGSVSPSLNIAGADGTPLRPWTPLRDGTFTARGMAAVHLIATGELTEVPVARVDSAGNTMAVIWMEPQERHDILALMQTDGFGGTFSRQPFRDSPLSAIRADGLLVVNRRAWSGSGEAAVEITMIGFEGDTLFTRELPYTPSPLPSERVDSAVRATTERLRGFSEGDIRQAVYRPSYLPPVSAIMTRTDGTIWLRGWDPIESEGGEQLYEWWVLDEQGEQLARALTPAGLRLTSISDDIIWGVESDELEVQYIVKYRLVKGG